MWENLWGLSYIHALFLLFPAQLLMNFAGDKSWAPWTFGMIHYGSLHILTTLWSCASVVSGEIWAVY